ncbi:MAG: hypothetical protein VCA34_12970, partial [Roseibacillus sp.]
DDNEYEHDAYWEVSASYSVELSAKLTANLSAEVGVWDTSPLNGTLDEGVHYSGTAALQYAASDNITLSAYITHSSAEDTLQSAPERFDDETYGGVSVSVSF